MVTWIWRRVIQHGVKDRYHCFLVGTGKRNGRKIFDGAKGKWVTPRDILLGKMKISRRANHTRLNVTDYCKINSGTIKKNGVHTHMALTLTLRQSTR